MNNDGFTDLIVGATCGFNSGSVRVLSYNGGGILYDFNGNSEFHLLGTSVSGAGDVNGDGFADLIIGAINNDNNGTDSGSARVLSGDDGRVLYVFDGDNPNSSFGFSVSGDGDVNVDGIAS